jgi:large subunit ribosomal protein L21e
VEPSIHKGMPHRRFQGRVGVVKERRGRSYVVTVATGGQQRQVIARPEHLRLFED